jgi:hypothetical protein
MADYRVVIFNSTGVRIKHIDGVQASELAQYRNQPNILINPEYPPGVPPHLWQLKDGKIVAGKEPMLASMLPRKKRPLALIVGALLGLALYSYLLIHFVR